MNLGSVTPSTPRERAGFQHSLIVGVLLYVCLHRLTQDDQIGLVTQYREGRVLGQPRHCICTNASRGLSAIAEFLVGDFAEGFPLFIRTPFDAELYQI